MEGTGIGLLKYEAKCNAFEVKAWPLCMFVLILIRFGNSLRRMIATSMTEEPSC